MPAQPFKPLSPYFLPSLIETRIAAHEAAHPAPSGMAGDWMGWHKLNRDFAEALLNELARDRGARFVIGVGDKSRLRLDGISISCTSGALQMLRGWVRKARRVAAEGSAK